MTKIISQGIKEKNFNTQYPEDAAKAFIGITAMVLQGIYHTEPRYEDLKRKFLATIDFLEKILGANNKKILDMYKKKGGQYV